MAKEISVVAPIASKIEVIKKAYVDYVLTENEDPKSVFDFAKRLKITEAEFYKYFSSFAAIKKTIWKDLIVQAINEIKFQPTWVGYNSREKILSFFYAYIELLKSQRSFVIYCLNNKKTKISTPSFLLDTKEIFLNFSEEVINEGLASGELADRKYFSQKYKDGLWLQLAFILNFWIEDDSDGFEKTDEAIERGVQLSFDLFQRSPLDQIFEYGKFLVRNGKLKEKMGL
ncbi:MAG: TetR family transcriptional regulator C-terminal domain-containing protein [Ginsengibacter sp.]